MDYFRKNKKNIIIAGSIFIILLIIYFVVTRDMGHKILFNKYDYFYNNRVEYVGSENMPDSYEGIKYTFSIWIRVENVSANAPWGTNDKTPKTILFNYGCPNIVYLRKENIVRIQILYLNDDGFSEYYDFDLDYFENQIWTNLIITVNNRNVNIYKNGELYTSKLIPHINIKTYKLLKIGEDNNNFNGYIGFLEYFNYVIDNKKIKQIYNSRKPQLPNKLMSYENYEYLRREEEEDTSNVSSRFKKFLV